MERKKKQNKKLWWPVMIPGC